MGADAEHTRRETVDVSDTTRRAVLDRDDNQCQSCGMGGDNRLQLHHVVFRSQLGVHNAGNLVTLCTDCHSDVHAALLVPALIEWAPGRLGWFFKRLRPPRRWLRKFK